MLDIGAKSRGANMFCVCAGVNPCPTNNGGCSRDADCSFIAGVRNCTCKTGFTGNGQTCAGEWVFTAYLLAAVVMLVDLASRRQRGQRGRHHGHASRC
jgi:hypothetical protein